MAESGEAYMSTMVIAKAIQGLTSEIERNLKVDRSVEIDERLLEIAVWVCVKLKINPHIGQPRWTNGDRQKHRRVIWFIDRVQKERFLEALSMVEEDPKEPIKPEDTVYVEAGADRRS